MQLLTTRKRSSQAYPRLSLEPTQTLRPQLVALAIPLDWPQDAPNSACHPLVNSGFALCVSFSTQLCTYLSLVNTLSWLSFFLEFPQGQWLPPPHPPCHSAHPEMQVRHILQNLSFDFFQAWAFRTLPSIMTCVADTTMSLEKFGKIFREAAKLINQSKNPMSSFWSHILSLSSRKTLTILFSIFAFLQVFETQKTITPSTSKQIIF